MAEPVTDAPESLYGSLTRDSGPDKAERLRDASAKRPRNPGPGTLGASHLSTSKKPPTLFNLKEGDDDGGSAEDSYLGTQPNDNAGEESDISDDTQRRSLIANMPTVMVQTFSQLYDGELP